MSAAGPGREWGGGRERRRRRVSLGTAGAWCGRGGGQRGPGRAHRPRWLCGAPASPRRSAGPRRAGVGGSALPPGVGLGMASADVPLARQSSGNVSPVPSRPPPEDSTRCVASVSHRCLRCVCQSRAGTSGQATTAIWGRQPLTAFAACGVHPVCHMLGSSSLEDCSHWLWVIVGKSDQR